MNVVQNELYTQRGYKGKIQYGSKSGTWLYRWRPF